MFRFRAVALVMVALAAPGRAADAPVHVHPTSLELRQHRQPHAIQVLGTTPDGFSLDLRSQARFTSADPNVAAVDENGWVRPVGAGQTQVAVITAGQTHQVSVKVQL